MNNTKEYIAPTVVLAAICIVMTIILSLTYSATKPVIEALEKESADQARTEVLAEGNSFTEVTGNLNEDIANVYTADNGAGVVITANDKGFGGTITVMVGFDSDGKISGLKVLKHAETPGLGTKAMTEDHFSQYIGQSEITGSGGVSIDAITGATVTSNAVYRAVEKALDQYEELGGVR